MSKNWSLLLVLGLLGYAFSVSSDFTVVAAGVAIFLFGMLNMEEGFKAFTGGALDKILGKSTDTVGKSLLFGIGTTTLMQSSSLVTVITISTLSAGLIALKGGIGIIYGANIGTTTGAWMLAAFGMKVKMSAYAMPMIVFGLILFLQKSRKLKGFGNILAGVGFIFLGIHYMKEGFEALGGSMDLSQFAMGGLTGLLVYTLIGMLATVVMQSSHATLMLTIAALADGQVTYDNGLALAIGSNIGTTITAVLGALSANIAGKRLAFAHVIFNVVTGFMAIVLISQLKLLVDLITGAVGIAADDWVLKLATFHTLFNFIGVAVAIPFIGRLTQFLENKVKDKHLDKEKDVVLQPIYLNESAMALADTAIGVLVKETRHLLENVFEIVAHGLNLHRHDIRSDRDLDEIVAQSRDVMDIDVMQSYYQSIKGIYNAIIDFATRAPAASQMNDEQMATVHNIRLACRDAAEIVKVISHLRENVSRYLKSKNEDIRNQYDLIRKNTANMMRELFRISDSDDEKVISATLLELGDGLHEQDVLANGALDKLVRSEAINSQMATSLMNDSALAYEVGKSLLDIAEKIHAARGIAVYQADGKKALEEH